MDEILGCLFEIVGEIVGDVVGEGLRAIFGSVDTAAWNTLWGTFLCFIAGAAMGLLSVTAMPDRVLPRPRMPGLSLVLGPLASGFVMRAWGSYRRGCGHAPGVIATFHGGAAFALGAALGRFVLVA